MFNMVSMEQTEIAALLGFAMVLISLGVDLCKDGMYEWGIILILFGLAILLVYFILCESRLLRLMK